MIPDPAHPSSPASPALPDIPVLCVNAREAFILTCDGELQSMPHAQAAKVLHKQSVMVCHAPYTFGRLGGKASDNYDFHSFDVLELFAFVHPGVFATPTVYGVCKALNTMEPASFEDAPMAMMDIARALLGDLRNDPYKAKANPLEIARVMGKSGTGWSWTPFIFSALGEMYEPSIPINSKVGLNVWKNLPEWAEEPTPPPASHHGVSAKEARERLTQLLGHDAEKRDSQMAFSEKIAESFAPKEDSDIPHVVLAEAGTGVGKTLGYLAAASVWAEKNKGSVWVSTYTKNLQRQIDQELDRLYPNPELKDTHVATRKGRENYLCLLNFEETAMSAALAKHPSTAIAAGIMARWVVATKDGDLTGAQYPGWLTTILGFHNSAGLADRRGECVYSACDHYSKCFVEHSVRKAKRARIVVANHALVMITAALAGTDEDLPSRYIFDEGHHLFNAADSAFAAHLTAQETRDMRRWILGNEGGRRASRARGLKRRAEDLCEGMSDAEEHLRKILSAAQCLPQESWTRRLRDGAPSGEAEQFLAAIYHQVHARANGKNMPYSLETEVFPVEDNVVEMARKLKTALVRLQKPMQALAVIFKKKLADDDGHLAADTRKRLEAVSASLERRSVMILQAWILMLENLDKGSDPAHSPVHKADGFVDWMEIARVDGRSVDVGLFRHHIDPMQPFARSIGPHVHGMAITSATLRDSTRDDATSWDKAAKQSGAAYLNPHAGHYSFSSPFNYAQQTKILIIDDVNKNDLGQVSGAYRALFQASGGGALGLFTAISRLRAVHERIAPALEDQGLPLYAQHMDEIDTGTLVDMFREDTHACLLGTDAIRDGVDVPGDSLRLIAFDRTPWPRPTLLHKARREAFGGRDYDDMLTRLKLKQAFGRLIRRGDDKGVFVMLDAALPSRLYGAFPDDVEIVKCGLSEAVNTIRAFLG